MTEAIEKVQASRLSVTNEHLLLAKNTIAKDLTGPEFDLYLYNCSRQGIHPLDGLLVPIKRNDTESGTKKLTFVSTVDLLRSRAAESGEYAGSEDATFEYFDGATNPQSATVIVWRLVQGQRCAFTATARWAEFFPGDRQGFMWKNKPHVMLGKCAEAQALRKAFPKELAGMYAAEEMERDDSTPPPPEPIRQTVKKEAAPVQNRTTENEPVQGEVVSMKAISEKQLKRLLAIQSSAGMKDDTLKDHLATLGITSRKLIPWKVYNQVIDFIDPEMKFHQNEEREAF